MTIICINILLNDLLVKLSGNMKIDRYMVTLFFEIRRNLPTNIQSDLKISDTNLGEKMLSLYNEDYDDNVKLLIQVFFERAGSQWISKLEPKQSLFKRRLKKDRDNSPRIKDKPLASKQAKKEKLIYRGTVIG